MPFVRISLGLIQDAHVLPLLLLLLSKLLLFIATVRCICSYLVKQWGGGNFLALTPDQSPPMRAFSDKDDRRL